MKYLTWFFLVVLSPQVHAKLLLYSDDLFIGCLDCVPSISDSVCNLEGRYGNPDSALSIWNPEGPYGSVSSPQSPWSGSMTGPIMMDEYGRVFGWFQINPQGGYTNSAKLNDLFHEMNGDLVKIRDAFCRD